MRITSTLLKTALFSTLFSLISLKSQAQCTTTITSFPFNESFESGFGTLWTGDIETSGSNTVPGWQTENSGVGNSANTGPTNAQDGNVYAYTEATNGTTGQIWNLNSPCFTFPTNSAPYISFYNHMLTTVGVTGMGYLYLQVNTNVSGVANWSTLFTDSGNNGDVWIQRVVDLSAYAGQTIQLRFQGVRGNSFEGDRAIDNILVSTGVETQNTYCVSGSHGSATANPIFGTGPYSFSWSTGGSSQTISNLSAGNYTVTITDALAVSNVVNFTITPGSVPVSSTIPDAEGWESGFGDWFNDTINDDFNWTVNSGGTPTGPTGPTSASQGSQYVYTESSGLTAFDQAILNSPCYDLDAADLPYFVFDYNMRVFGGGGSASDMGILWLIADATPNTNFDADTIWTQVGASGANWLTDSVDLSVYGNAHVTLRFVGQLSNGITQYGDRAVDNLKIKSGVKIQQACASTNSGSIELNPQFGTGTYSYSWNTGSSSNPYGSLNAGTYTVTISNTSAPSQVHSYTVGGLTIPTPTGLSSTLSNYCENNLQSTTLSVNYLVGDATFNGTSPISNDLGPNGTVGAAVNYSIPSTPPFATDQGTITFYYRGDVEAPGEYVNVISENGVQIGIANVSTTQCALNFVQETFTVPVDSINSWASNYSIDFVGSPFGMTRYCGFGTTRYSQEGQVSITYPYSTNKPYWFANSCDNVIANAVDSGFIVTLSPSTTTTYYVRYYNTQCQSWGACESITITVNPKPTISITPPNPSYCSTPTTLTASGANTYSWSPGTGLNNTTSAVVQASPSSTTNYQVIGTDLNSCADTTNITVTVTTGPSVSLSQTNPTCNGGTNGSLSALASGGSGSYTYLWSNGATSSSISGLSAGTYTVTVNDGSTCTAVQSAVISAPAAISVTIAGNNIGCSGFSSGSAFAFVTGGTPTYSYLWSNGATSNVAFALAAGTYTVTVTDANGCTGSQNVTITQPTAPLTSSITATTNVSCFGGNNGTATAAGSGGTPSYSYAWSSGANSATATNLSAGTYICTVSDANGCVSVAIAVITQPATAVAVSIASSTNVTCNGGNNGSATASGSGGTGAITYAWSNGASGVTATGLIAGTYTVTATDANGCTDTETVTITQPTVVTASFTTTNVSCFGGGNGSISATGSGGNGGAYSFLWNTGATTSSITGLSAGNYTVTITDNAGCTGIESQSVTQPAVLTASIALGNNVSCNGGSNGSATASASGGTTAYSFAWSNGASTAAVTGLAAGTYTVTVTDANLCTDTETITITQPTPVVAATSLNNNVSCFGGNNGSATASASGGTPTYTYAWSNGGTTATVSNLTAGTFTVTATDANGCTDTETITITQPASAVTAAIALGSNVSCNGGNNGSATASASGGTPTYTYAWSNGSSTATATGLAAGTYTVTVTDANSCTDTETITITQPTVLVASIALGNNVSCNGGSNGSATASATGGTTTYSFAWSNGATTAAVTGLAAGTYTVTVTDANSCIDTETITITQPTILVASIALGNNVSCNGGSNGSATASASGGTTAYSFAWSNGASTAAVTGLTAGTYTVTVTDANLCTDTETITITQPTPVVAATSLNNNVSCFGGNNGSATASASGGTPTYTYAWSNGGTTATVSNLTAGTFTVTATDANGCTDTETITITQPASAVTAAIALGSNVSCNGGNNGSATASASGGTPTYTYAWSNGSSTATATGLAAGTYTVTVTDANSCTDTETITITQPTVLVASIALGNNVSCNGGSNGSATASATGGTTTYSFAWSNGATTAAVTGLAAGTYTVTVTDANSCIDTETITITQPTILVASIALGNNVSCNGGSNGSATASASGGTTAYSFAWSNGASTAAVTGLAAGTYTVTVTDANLCTDTETITITQPTPVVAATSLNNNVSCFGGNNGSATASASGGTPTYTYAWSNGGTTATVTNLTAGTFTVTATDANGCTDTETITITQPASAVTAAIALGNNVSCNGGNNGSATASASGGTPTYTYAWSNGSSTATATGLAAGTYTVTVTDANSCSDTETITITQPTVLVASIALGNNVSCNGGNNGSATASATGGTTTYSFAWSNGASTAAVTGLAAGTYTVTVTDANSCTDTETITITQPTVLVASIALGNNVSCNGGSNGSATASGSGGTTAYSFAWSNGATTSAVTGLAAGTYTVTVTDANLCTDTETITITQPTPVVASIVSSSNISCFGLFNGSAVAGGSGGTSPYSYAWSSGASTATATGLGAGTFTVTVTDANGCTDTETVTITQPTQVVASTSLVNNVSCNGGNNGSATASASGGTPTYTYAWSNGGTTATVSNLTAGTFTVTATDANGCTDTETITITQPAVLVAAITLGNNVSCNGGNDGSATASATGGTTTYSFAWSNGATTSTVTGLAAGTYTVTVTDANSCTDTETITITQPTILVASIALGINVSCNGGNDGSATASASGGTTAYSFAWSNGASTAFVTGLAAGTFTVTATDANGCTDTETITITEPTPVLAATLLNNNVSCFGGNDGSATASATGGTAFIAMGGTVPYIFVWSNGDSTATVSNLTAGIFTVTATDSNGCTDTETITITEPTPVIAAAALNNNVSCNGGNDGSATASASGGTPTYTYAWSNGGTTATVSNLTSGTFTVTATDANGCTDTETITILEPLSLEDSVYVINDVSCNGGSDGSAGIIATGGTPAYSYAWSNGSTANTTTNLSAGTYFVTVTDANGCTKTDSVVIIEPLPISLTTTTSNVLCFGAANGTASVVATGGTSPYTYLWSTGNTLSTATNLSPGTYGMTVTDANGCTATTSVTITQPIVLVATASVDSNVSCNAGANGQASATASGGTTPYTYLWSNGDSLSTAENLIAGTYTVTITDFNGCTSTSSITITEPTLLVLTGTVANNVSCFGGSNGSASVIASGGTSPYSYLWSNGSTNTSLTNLAAGTYTIFTTDANSCMETTSITITEPTLLVAATAVTANVSCNGGNDGVAMSLGVGGTAPYSYAWSNGATTVSITGLSAGTYTVTITDANGCSDSEPVTITEPTVLVASAIVGSNASCFGAANGNLIASASGGTSPYTYAWSNGGSTAIQSGIAAGTYTVTATDANGCTSTASATITEPTLLVISASATSTVSCNGGNDGVAAASAVGGTQSYSYFWSTFTTGDTITGLAAGTYSVTVTDAFGCTDSTSVTVSEPTPVIALAVLNSNVSCNGGNDGSATASATGGTGLFTYAWSNLTTNATASVLTAGTYIVTATDANGCSDTASVAISEPTMLVAATTIDSNVSCNGLSDGGASASASGGTLPYTYAWSNGATTSSITGLIAGTYNVTFTDANGCTDSEQATVTEPASLAAAIALNNNVSCNGGNDGSATASGSGGTLPYSFAWSNGGSTATVSSLAIGTYTVTITDFNNCTDIASITITEPAALIAGAVAINNALCSGSNTGSAEAIPSGGTAPYTYAWSNSTLLDTAMNLAAGTYSVTITDANGCFDSASVTINEPSSVIANAILISDAACNGSASGSAEADQSGGTAPYIYSWSNGSSNDTIQNLTAGTYILTVTDANGCAGTDTVLISQPTLLTITIDSINDASCNGGNDGSVITITSGGTAPYTYVWSNGVTTANISGLSAGSYTVTVTDANGCTAAINPIIQQPSVLGNSMTVSNVSCNGGNDGFATASGIGATSPYTYAWNTGSLVATAGGLSIGTYTVTITDDNGCSGIFSATITEPTLLVASILSTDSVNCAGDSTGSIIAGIVGGTMPYSYSWPSIGSANDSLLSLIPVGTYTVTITDANGCIDSASATINEYPSLVVSIDSSMDVTCAGGNDGYASVIASGGAGGFTYAWTNGATGASTNLLTGGLQCVTVTDANGCSETVCTTLNETFSLPVVDLGNDTLLCDTVFTITSSSAATYAWNTLENTQSIVVQTSGTYTVTVTDSNGCENSDDIVVNFNPYLDFEIDTDSTLCASATGSASIVNLTGGGGYNVNWSTGQIGGITASGLAYGAYSVSITDANGCQATESFFIYNDTDLEFTLSAIDVSCFGANDGQASVAIVNGTAPFAYNWSNGTSNDTASNLMGGTYSVTVSDSNGCEVIDSIAISEPDQVTYSIVTADANCGANDGFAAVTNISPAGFYTYAWNDPSLQTTDTASALGAGVYQVTVTAANGCADSSIAIVSNINAPTLAMSAIDETCEGSENGSAIVNASGAAPLTYLWSDALMQTTDTASALGAGLYFVTVTDNLGCIAIDTVSVNTLSPLPMPDLGADTLICETNFDLTPGAGFTSYLWSDGSTGDTLNITASGIYSVTVSNAGGCENVDSVDITLSTPIAFTSTINNSSCSQNTGSVTLVTSGGTGTIEYAWSTGDTLAFISNVGAGNYLVTINDSVGCSVEADFDVDNINAPVVTINTTDLSCFGDNSGTATSSITGGTAPFTYAWSNGTVGTSANGLAAGNYDLTVVDDSGCVVIEPFTITEPAEINIAISFVQPTCGDTNGSAVASATNGQGPIVSYLWDDPSNTAIADLDPIPAGFYTVTVTDSAGCQAVENVAISNLGAAILATTATDNNCSNDNTAFATVTAIGSAPFTYEWNDALAQTSDTAFNLFNGTYAVSVTDIAGCIAVDAVTIGSSFDTPTLDLGNDINACIGSEVILTAGGGYASYSWNTGATTPSIVATASQAFDLTVSNAGGCFGSDTINVQFVTQPIVDLGSDTIVCIDDFSPTITLDAGEGFNFYEWSTNETTQTIDVSSGGVYSVSVSEFFGCAGSDQIIVLYDTCVNVTTDEIISMVAPSLSIYPNPNRGQFTIESKGLPEGKYNVRIMNASGQSIVTKSIQINGSVNNRAEIDMQTSARGLYMLILEGESIRMDQRVIIQ